MGKKEEWKEKFGDIDPWEDENDTPPSEKLWDYDSRNIRYNRNAGSKSPTKGRCNALLNAWEERYGEPRYCTRIATKWYPNSDEEYDWCYMHKDRDGLMKQARDIMQHGMVTKTFAHFFDKSDPVEKIFIIGLFESLIDESVYDFECNKQSIELDFSKSDYSPEEFNIDTEDGTVLVHFPQPTNHETRALALLSAATDEVKMLKANSQILEAAMTSESATKVATTEDGRIGEVYEEKSEHYLNLPYSRLVKDHKENLKRGGVDIEGIEKEDTSTGEVRNLDVELPSKEDFETGKVSEDTKEVIPVSDEEFESELED